MFKHILVPLDGSKLAEVALPAAASLAQTLHAPVTLLHIIEQEARGEIHKDHHLTEVKEAEAYLAEAAKRFFSPAIRVKTHIHTKPVADVVQSIVWHATREFQPDLIVMCSHGRGGMRDLLFGNIAQQVVAQGATPVLLIKPKEIPPHPFHLEKILVPLESESLHDDSLPYAESLARACQAEIHLLSVIPTLGTLAGGQAAAGSMLPGTATAYLEMEEEHASEHLQEHLATLLEANLRASAEVARGDPAPVIAKTAEAITADLIVLSTHRKAGMDAFWARSVAPNVARRTDIPLLFIPLPA